MQLSKLESEAYEVLRKNNLEIFKILDLSLILKINKTQTYNLIKALKKKKAVMPLKAGLYALSGTSDFVIGANLNWPSYVSFLSALNYYGLSDNMPRKITFASTKYRKETDKFKYATLSKKRFFGYINAGGIIIADKEKAIIDSLLFPKYSGGMREVINAVRISEPDFGKLIDYSLKIGSRAVVRRLGFILEKTGVENAKLKILQKNIGKGYELLDPSLKKQSNLNNRWLLDINIG